MQPVLVDKAPYYAAELAAQNPRQLVVDDAAIQLRNEIAANLLSYYEFVTALHLPARALRHPPKEGWSYINAERFAFMHKTDAVIDLLKHIPYISQDRSTEYEIDVQCTARDYISRDFRSRSVVSQLWSEPPLYYHGIEKGPTWLRLKEPQHIAVLARPTVSVGRYILLDTRDGKTAIIQPRNRYEEVECEEFDTLKQYLDKNIEELRTLVMIPIAPTDLVYHRKSKFSDWEVAQVKNIYRKHGWRSCDFDKNACLLEIKQFKDGLRRNRE